MRLAAISDQAHRFSRWPAIALGFSVPVSVALDNVLIVLLLILWVSGGRFREKAALIRANPVALASCVLFAAFAAGSLWSVGTAGEVVYALDKAVIFLLVPVFISAFSDERDRALALRAFIVAMIITLALSFLVSSGALPETRLLKGSASNAAVFKNHITHSLLMAFGAFLFAVLARCSTDRNIRLLYGVLSALAAFSVLFLVQGRTGQLVLLALLVYFLAWALRWKGLLAAGFAVVLIAATVYALPSSTAHQRIKLAAEQLANWQPGQASPIGSSIGLRLEFYRNSLALVRENPLLGVGTGGFSSAYATHTKGAGMVPTRNPHNEYLMITVQLGIVGLALLLFLFGLQWRLARRLPGQAGPAIARGLVITIALASAVSSTLMDHTEGLFFAWMSGLVFSGLSRRTA